jgi:hypothetical protein
MLARVRHALLLGGAAALAGVLTLPERVPLAQVVVPDDDEVCAQQSAPSRIEGAGLSTQTAGGRDGVLYDSAGSTLELARVSGTLRAENVTLSGVHLACSGDFDEDGWTDFVAGDLGFGKLTLYRNTTSTTTAPDWNVLSATRDPSFTPSTIEASSFHNGVGAVACGDIDGDANLDVLLMRCTSGNFCFNPERAVAFLGNGDGSFDSPYQFWTDLTKDGVIDRDGARIALHDFNRDGRLDLIVGMGGSAGASITAYMNDGATQPKFDTQQTVRFPAGAGQPAAGV